MVQQTSIYLASSSPRRRELLTQIGVIHESLTVIVDETPLINEDPTAYVTRLALAKARAGWNVLGIRPPRPVLGADTAVMINGIILGKPRDREEGLRMLYTLSGCEHRVLSAVALVADGHEALRLQESRVWFRELSLAECQAYWDTGEPADKAGGYAIQGRGAIFIKNLQGSYSGVMGLPLFETSELLQSFAIKIL